MPETTDDLLHLHNFSVPLSDDKPHARRCSVCGVPQQYRAPVGQGGPRFTDVLVDQGDLRTLIGAWREAGEWPNLDIWELCDRLEFLLDSPAG